MQFLHMAFFLLLMFQQPPSTAWTRAVQWQECSLPDSQPCTIFQSVARSEGLAMYQHGPDRQRVPGA